MRRSFLPRAAAGVVMVVALGMGAPATASEQEPLFVLGGLNYLNASGRGLTDGKGIYGALGYVSQEPAILGNAGFDFDWRHNEKGPNRIDSIGISYAERDFTDLDPFYFGFGVGSTYNRVERHQPFHNSTEKHLRLGAKAMLGIQLGYNVVVESAFFYSGHDNGVDTSGLVFALGFWF
jgi:hypothetical protein